MSHQQRTHCRILFDSLQAHFHHKKISDSIAQDLVVFVTTSPSPVFIRERIYISSKIQEPFRLHTSTPLQIPEMEFMKVHFR
jgi:hypothetical protein